MTTLTRLDPLVEQLMQCEGKAEIVDGQIQELPMTGDKPSYASGKIFIALFLHAERTATGRAVQDGAGFLCDLPNRRSFSPDAAFYTGESGEMGFFPSPPIFAVEVRSENDYGPRAEREMAQKRADYFAAGTLVVWDVDLQGEEVIAKYHSQAPQTPEIFRRGELANAQPAINDWTMPVDDLFPNLVTA